MKVKFLFVISVLVTASFGTQSENAIDILHNLCDSLLNAPGVTGINRLAVLPFSENGNGNSETGRAVAEEIITGLNVVKKFVLVDRIDFQKMIQEIDLSSSDIADDSTAIKAGKLMVADAVLVGSIDEVFGANRIKVKVIRTETSEIVWSIAITIAPAALNSLVKNIMGERTQVSATVFRSVLIPGWGQFYSNKKVRGSICLVLGTGSLGYLGYTCVQSAQKRSELASLVESGKSNVWNNRLDEYSKQLTIADKAQKNAYKQAATAGIITGAVWVLNLIDATFAGVQSKRKFEPYFSIDLNKKNNGILCLNFNITL